MNPKTVLTKYTIPLPCLSAPLKAALITDLHEHDPEAIISLLRETRPDLIFMAGDIFEFYDKKDRPQNLRTLKSKLVFRIKCIIYGIIGNWTKNVCPENSWRLLEEACALAPVYMSSGNHEWHYSPEALARLEALGATLLDNADTQVQTPAGDFRLGGFPTICKTAWLKEFAEKEGCKLLLSHHPEYYDYYIAGTQADRFQLILSGHTHGGQLCLAGRHRLPLFAPSQGFFPKYHHGSYKTAGGQMIVGSGCCNTIKIPRIGNPCELVLLELIPENNP